MSNLEDLKNAATPLNFIYKLHEGMMSKNLKLIYEGDFSQDILKAVLSMTEKQLESIGEDGKIKKKVFNIMVECLQNICKHTEDNKIKINHKSAIFMVGFENEEYFICTGNPIKQENVELLKMKLAEINNLDKEGLKALYMEVVSRGAISDRGGAGLGLIDIARKSGKKLEYSFEEMEKDYLFFSLLIRIPRN
ncbi:MAG: hypothetical protein A2X12_02770 [Bacteroidetes bacterium GWE2_29_8]|nr:MAG: hypothetical protein A2X12_02770 [Bacteroidetes bacterium GWE2_29_8]OFY20097.1 MAG: hypothetical protein A2X02_06965 [Bacteroidetes bacterium GWF2_29_10]